MGSKNIFENENVKLRLIDLEYSYKKKFASSNPAEVKKAKEEFESDIRRIYKEETKQELTQNIEIYTSKEIVKQNKESGYDGTAIQIVDKKHNVDQLHIISEGSADNKDWSYNFFGLFLGIDDNQYKATKEFTRNAKNKAGNKENLKTFALGHSLANNNQVMVQLIDGQYDEVYGVNGAQISTDHLLKADKHLRYTMLEKFKVDTFKELLKVPKSKLKKAIVKYYNDKGVTANITQRISKDDPLYGVSGKADFITFGDVKMTDTNHDVKGIRNLIDQIPDEDVRRIQKYWRQYSSAYQKNGFNGFLKEAAGIDLELINNFKKIKSPKQQMIYMNAKVGDFFSMADDIAAEVKEKLPKFLGFVDTIMKNKDIILDQLEANGYIDNAQKAVIEKDLGNIDKEISTLKNLYQQLMDNKLNFFEWKGIFDKSKDSINRLIAYVKQLGADTEGLLSLIAEGHSITPLLNALSKKKGISYKGGDIYFSKKGKDGKEIKVNLSSAVRIYQAGMAAISKIEDEIDRYQRVFHHEIHDHFANKKAALTKAIHDMEANPSHYQYDFQFKLASGFAASSGKLNKIVVHDSYHTAPLPECDGIISELKKQTSEKKRFVKDIRSSIEKLCDEDKQISALFDFKA
ncbi:DUF6792 domain-containing protein [Bacillus glycinifermentans]|uniref:DUF6792 domain-containing protein n=1 Tax=Bacillus glycinifermentans TaxID=1664069 RepID=A0A0T6BVI7_9BACI|nr:DUF6792 domain-containing protein [Bacillus glycinifermentans]ATH94223.1 hypothetical protein COP00_17730 [Bacillus glycinifermentans]KRT95647.1 hypothetical protein AB447_200605 [Bacillus glycinifermentans]MEC0484474.1 hypothetical protein [Bacillus glycinifermentans]